MDRFKHRVVVGLATLATLAGCQASPPGEQAEQESSQETAAETQAREETTVLEETFEAGDTGEMSPKADAPAETGKQDKDNP